MVKPKISRWIIALLVMGLILSMALIGIFAFRSIIYMPHRREAEPIRPWMSIPYIAYSYRIPSKGLFQALGLPDNPRDRRPLAAIAREQNRTVQSVIQTIYQAIIAAHPSKMPPTPVPLNPPRSAP